MDLSKLIKSIKAKQSASAGQQAPVATIPTSSAQGVASSDSDGSSDGEDFSEQRVTKKIRTDVTNDGALRRNLLLNPRSGMKLYDSSSTTAEAGDEARQVSLSTPAQSTQFVAPVTVPGARKRFIADERIGPSSSSTRSTSGSSSKLLDALRAGQSSTKQTGTTPQSHGTSSSSSSSSPSQTNLAAILKQSQSIDALSKVASLAAAEIKHVAAAPPSGTAEDDANTNDVDEEESKVIGTEAETSQFISLSAVGVDGPSDRKVERPEAKVVPHQTPIAAPSTVATSSAPVGSIPVPQVSVPKTEKATMNAESFDWDDL